MRQVATAFGGKCHIIDQPPKIDLSNVFGFNRNQNLQKTTSRNLKFKKADLTTESSNWNDEESKVSSMSWMSRVVDNQRLHNNLAIPMRKMVDIKIPKPFDGREQAQKLHSDQK
jgi:hypothetical protein